MKFYEEAPWVFGVSPHTGKPKTLIHVPRKPDELMLCKQSGEIVKVMRVYAAGYLTVFKVGGVHPIYVKRLFSRLGDIEILSIESVDVRLCFPIRCRDTADGFKSTGAFLRVWARRHDYMFYKEHFSNAVVSDWDVRVALRYQPKELYAAWAITFKPVA